jgi:hypothetical protein
VKKFPRPALEIAPEASRSMWDVLRYYAELAPPE